MANSKFRRRVRLSAYLISPLPAAMGLLSPGAAQAAPTANPDTFTVPYNSRPFGAAPVPVIGNVLGNDTGTQPLMAVDNTFTTAFGNFALLGNGNVYLSADGGNCQLGSETLPYSMFDATNSFSASTFTVTLISPLVNDSYMTNAGTAVSGNVRDNDLPNGNTLSVATFYSPGSGNLVDDTGSNRATNGNFTYTPNAGFSGQDYFGYAVDDSIFGCGWNALVQVTVLPVANPDSYSTPYQTSVAGNVLTNDLGSGLQVTGNIQPAHGSANVATDGSFVYVPDPGFSGPDSFQYIIEDNSGDGEQASAVVTIDVAGNTIPAPATSPIALGLLGTLLAWLGLRRRRAR